MKLKTLVLFMLSLAAVVSWGHTLLTTHITYISSSPYGLAQFYPVSYWFGLVFCLVLMAYVYQKDSSIYFHILSLAIFLLIIYGTPHLIEENARFPDSYLHMGSVRNVVSEAHVGEETLNYSYFPGYFALLAIFLLMTSISPFFVMKYHPFFSIFMISVWLYLLAYKFTKSKRYSILAPSFYFAFAWFLESHVSPQSLALVLYMMILYLFLMDRNNDKKRVSVISIAMVSLIVTHPASSLFLILFLAVLYLLERSQIHDLKFPFFLTLFLAWAVFGSSTFFNNVTLNIYEKLTHGFSLDTVLRTFFAHGWSSLSIHQTIINDLRAIQFSSFILVFILVMLSGVKGHIRKVKIPHELTNWVISCFLFGVFISIGAYGLFERIGLFGLIPICITFVYAIQKHMVHRYLKIGLIIVIFASILVLPITRYGNESYEYVPSVDIRAQSFVTKVANNETVVGYWPTISYLRPEMRDNNISCVDIRKSETGGVIIFTSVYRNMFVDRLGNYTIENEIQNFSNSTLRNRVYDNGFSVVFTVLESK